MGKQNFQLAFSKREMEKYADGYEYISDDKVKVIGEKAKEDKCLSKDAFLELCKWKTHRSKSRCNKNPEELIKEVTQLAFTTKSERLRIEALTLLDGVMWPTASAILHFCHKDDYPILDFRALESLGFKRGTPSTYNFNFWWQYTIYCRRLSHELDVDMRTIDKGLWQYSKQLKRK